MLELSFVMGWFFINRSSSHTATTTHREVVSAWFIEEGASFFGDLLKFEVEGLGASLGCTVQLHALLVDLPRCFQCEETNLEV